MIGKYQDPWRPIDHGFPKHGFENCIINRLIDGIFQLINAVLRLMNGIDRLVNGPIDGLVGQLVARSLKLPSLGVYRSLNGLIGTGELFGWTTCGPPNSSPNQCIN